MKKNTRRAAAVFLAALLTAASFPTPAAPLTASAASAKILAFPGAVGGGKYATGGRGGEVYHVTNLNDSGAGSLRDAVSKSGRIVVFDVSGTITLSSNIVCSSNITIAGQTAPGGSGVTLKNYKFGMGGDNIIVRYLSSRPGPDKATSSGNDAWGGAKGSNSIVDHCSLGWTTDEQWGLYSNNDHYTVQYSVIGPANSWGGHVKGVHGFGLMMGRSNLTFDHNLICHNVSRNFRGKVVGTETADFTNNIIYDWGYQTAYGTIGHVNYVNNTLKTGNSTASGYHYVQVSANDNFKLYLNGNRIINKDNSYRNSENDNWSAIKYTTTDKYRSNTESTTPFTIMSDGENISTALTCESAAASYDHVISFAGNGISPDKRTKIDRQCAEDTKNGTGSCSGTDAYTSSQSELDKYHIACGVTYEYPAAVTRKEITDNDNDGMDDSWELARGLNPNDPTDYKGDYCGQGYMNIEYYINDLTVDSFPKGVVELSPETGSAKICAVMDTTVKYEITNASNGALLGNAESWRLEDCGDGYYRIVNAANGSNLSGSEQYKFVRKGSGYVIYTKSSEDKDCVGGNDTVWNVTVKLEPLTGRLISSLAVKDQTNYKSWKLADGLKQGDLIYGDRDAAYQTIPDFLIGAEMVQTSCDSKNTDSDLAELTAAKDITVVVALDSRVTAVPDWLKSWGTFDSTIVSSTDVTYKLFGRKLAKGEKITLGTNGQSSGCVNYAVLATDGSTPGVAENADLNGDLFKQLTVLDTAHASGWKVAKDLKTGALLYGDRDVTYTSIPDSLSGAEYLITACDSKQTDSDLAAFKAGKDMTLYVALDNRVTNVPSWMSGFAKTGMTAANSNAVTYDIYSKDVKSGTLVTLGTNGQSSGCVNYTVFAKAAASTADPVYPEITKVEYSEQTHQIRLTWAPVKGATSYAVGAFVSGRWRILVPSLSALSYTSPKNLTPGKSYKVAVAAKVNGVWTLEEAVKHAVTVTVK
ncbi:Pectate lyase [Ruminococcus sp. YE71]|uniref:fibronectin type III domain-containing protein n=1 Tax=unclassified Ruminococcus TaxID=2608920 RepID=UPI000891D22A|nr:MULTISPECIES: fibronectin type III domain-containing protein [unclassified Ruminococcus]SDA26656.1 Pectate lyase [Ruminococcus sp. YE78]SFW44356.1 Pectate lyase [Ruminococcus sp. YE71]